MGTLTGAIVTAVLAVLVFVIGQAMLRFVLEPVQEQNKLIGEVAHALLYYSGRGDHYGFQAEELQEGRKHLRNLAGRLRASLFYVPFYRVLARLGLVPKKEHTLEAARQLLGWSNTMVNERSSQSVRNEERRMIIASKLGIQDLL